MKRTLLPGKVWRMAEILRAEFSRALVLLVGFRSEWPLTSRTLGKSLWLGKA